MESNERARPDSPRIQPPSEPDYSGLDLREVLDRLVGRRLAVLGCAMGFSVAAIVLALVMPPVYRAEVLLSYVTDESSSGALEDLASRYGALGSLAGLNFGSSTQRSKDLSIAVLRSRQFTHQFFARHNVLPALFSSKWDAEAKAWKSTDPDAVPTPQDAYRLWDRTVRSVQMDRKSGLITLTIDWRDPKQAAQWAQDLVVDANEYLRQNALEESNANLQFIENKLSQTNMLEIRQSLFRLMEAELKKAMFATASREYALKVIDPAEVPEKRLSPKRRLIVMGGLLLGLAVGIVWALLAGPPSRSETD